MKSTTGKQTVRPTTGSIPKEHETLSIEETEAFGEWLDVQLEQLEGRFTEFSTRHSLMVEFASGR